GPRRDPAGRRHSRRQRQPSRRGTDARARLADRQFGANDVRRRTRRAAPAAEPAGPVAIADTADSAVLRVRGGVFTNILTKIMWSCIRCGTEENRPRPLPSDSHFSPAAL